MPTILRDGSIVLVPDSDDEAREVKNWLARHEGHVLEVRSERQNGGFALELTSLGPGAEACREPINIVSASPDPAVRLMSNFGPAPFEMDGERYQSIESFWQSLKFDDTAERRRIAALDAHAAHGAGDPKGYGATISYGGEAVPVGTYRHWHLMERACRAKFTQHAEARAALLATGTRPLVHILPKDSRAIPGAIMAEIWMRIRGELQAETGACA